MNPALEDLKAVVLCGGQSSRMGSPKHLLELPNHKSLLQHTFNTISRPIPSSKGLYVSSKGAENAVLEFDIADYRIHTLFDQQNGDIGPAAGLLTAHREDPASYWFMVACDYPLLSDKELKRLVHHYQEPVTCYQKVGGPLEPLVSIWSPEALVVLKSNVENGITGPRHVIDALKGTAIIPSNDDDLLNTNTPEEWEAAMKLYMKRKCA